MDLIDLARVALPHRKAIFFMPLLHLIHVALELRLHGFTMEPGPTRAGWAPAQVAASDLDINLSVLRKRLVLDHLVPSLQLDTKLVGGGGRGRRGGQPGVTDLNGYIK